MSDIELMFCRDSCRRGTSTADVHDGRCRPHVISVACRPDASLAELAIASEITQVFELVARMRNPFVPTGADALSCSP